MTGIDRLRTLAGAWDEWGLGGALMDVADQIEREHVSRIRVMAVLSDMERHVSGVEGADDSPVARWARELRDALGGEERDPAEDVSMSAYDLLPQEERDAIAWVREHGGLERVKAQRRESIPRAAYERKKASFLDHIAECETALRRRRRCIEELEGRVKALTTENAEMRKRAMPEGMEWLVDAWPRFEDDSPVHFGDAALIDGEADMVEAIQLWIHGKPVIYGDGGSQQLEKGERVRRPVADTWERLEEDCAKSDVDYCAERGLLDSSCDVVEGDGSTRHCTDCGCTCGEKMARDIVRRAKALAERERGE